MERKSKAEVKKLLEQMKNPKANHDHEAIVGGAQKGTKKMNSGAGSKTYRPKI